MKSLYAVFFLILCSCFSFAQTGKDSLSAANDSVKNQAAKRSVPDSLKGKDSTVSSSSLTTGADTLKTAIDTAGVAVLEQAYRTLLGQHPYFNFFGVPQTETVFKDESRDKDGLFYLLAGLILYFALIRLLFYKYMTNLFAVFFRVSLKQKQIREQLLQSTLPSMLLNIFFVIAGGIYISFLLDHYHFNITSNKWYLIVYCIVSLALIYIVKLVVLKCMGWILNISIATETYIFVVFLVSKMLGIFLIPFLVLLAFSSPALVSVLIVLSFAMVTIFFAYRYIIAYSPVRKEIKVSQLHFFLYICALEITPLLLIYKVLFTYLERST